MNKELMNCNTKTEHLMQKGDNWKKEIVYVKKEYAGRFVASAYVGLSPLLIDSFFLLKIKE